jgi:hypothetical protein
MVVVVSAEHSLSDFTFIRKLAKGSLTRIQQIERTNSLV